MRSALNLCIALGMAFAIGCAKPPVEELNAARAALDAAKQAEADIYAPETYRSANNLLNDANAKSEAESQKTLFKDYEPAKAAAVQAREMADRSRSEAQTAKQQTRDEAQAIVNRVAAALSEVRASFDSAPRGKGADEDLDQINAELSQVEASLNTAQSHLGSGKYKDALPEARNAETRLAPIQGSVQAAVQKIDAWKERNKPWYLRL